MSSPTPAFMRLTTQDGATHDVPIDGPGGTFRFAVGRPGLRSGVWRVWANKSTADVYFTSREVSGMHTSFHASGKWHHKFTDEATALTITGKADPYMDKWERPEANQIGWTTAYSVWIPAGDVIEVPKDRQTASKVTWFDPPDDGWLLGVHVVIAKPDLGEANLTNAQPVAAFTLCSSEIVLFLVSRHRPADAEQASIDSARAQVAERFDQAGLNSKETAYRTTVWANGDDGSRILYDLALFPREAGTSPPS